jgi:hypothetical protein
LGGLLLLVNFGVVLVESSKGGEDEAADGADEFMFVEHKVSVSASITSATPK